jgi:hypothetical protein
MGLSDDMAVDPVPEADIVIHRTTRFSGETATCSLDEFTDSSLDNLRWLYDWLEQVGAFSARDFSDAEVLSGIEAFIAGGGLKRVVESVRNVTPAQTASLRVSRLLHDLRGTALQQVVGLASLWQEGEVEPDTPRAVAILARDHAKLLRHSLIGLDEQRRLLDVGLRLHGVANLRNRMPWLLLSNDAGTVRIDFAAAWHGDFAITCPEFSTVLRQLYNLMGNAARHTANQLVLIRVYPTHEAEPRSVRFSVANALTPAEYAMLSPGVVARSWRGYTTTGSGLGLVKCRTGR